RTPPLLYSFPTLRSSDLAMRIDFVEIHFRLGPDPLFEVPVTFDRTEKSVDADVEGVRQARDFHDDRPGVRSSVKRDEASRARPKDRKSIRLNSSHQIISY